MSQTYLVVPEGAVLVEPRPDGGLTLRINSQQVASVPQNSILSIENDLANGALKLTVEGDPLRLPDVLMAYSKPDTTDPTSP